MGNLKLFVVSLLLASITVACKPGASPQIAEAEAANAQVTPWLNQLIQELQEATPANPPSKIYRYTYNGQKVYYLTGRCCDIPGKVYNAQGNILCEPDGGITGNGDGRCTDFLKNGLTRL